MSKILDRISKFKDRNKTSSSRDENEDIFFDFTEGTHRVRLVREWVCVHSHWIAPSKYSKVKLYDESAFEGEDRLKKSVNCPDFDINTETTTEEKTCVICKLRAAANDILYEHNDLDKDQKTYLENIAHDCYPNERIFFLCIDRDNPEIAPGKKGFKIIEFPKPLMEKLINLIEGNEGYNPTSDEEGADFIIKKERDKNRMKYDIIYAMRGKEIAQTPLTEEERGYEFHDIKKIMCKMPDQEKLYDRLKPDFRELLKDSGFNDLAEGNVSEDTGTSENNSYDDDDETVPF